MKLKSVFFKIINESICFVKFSIRSIGLSLGITKFPVDFWWHVVALISQFFESPVKTVENEH